MTTLKRRLLPPLILLLILIGFFWKVTLTRQFTWLENEDNAYQVLPWLQLEAQAIHHGHIPLWDPYLWGGQSLIGQMQPGLVYPLNWLLFAAPLKDGFIRFSAVHAYRVLLHWLAAVFMFWLCRDLGRSRMASVLGGIAFALSGEMGTTPWLQKLNGMIWIPLILLFFLRALAGRRFVWNAALCGFFLGISWLSGHHQLPLYTTLVLAAIWASRFYQDAILRRQRAILGAVCAVFFAFTAAPQMLPSYVYGRQAVRWVGLSDAIEWQDKVPFNIHAQYSLGLVNVFGFLIPGFEREAAPYMGPVLLSLAAIGICLCWKDTRVRLFAVIALAGFLFSLGSQDVLYGPIYALVPMVEKARAPALAVVWSNFGGAVLAAFAIDALRSVTDPYWPRKIAAVLAITGALILTVALAVLVTKQLRLDFDDRMIGVAIWALLAAALYSAYLKQNLSSTAFGVCCLLLVLVDLGNSTGYYYIHQLDAKNTAYFESITGNQDIRDWLRQQPGPFRFGVNRDEVPANWGDWYGMDTYNGYVASMPSRVKLLGLEGYRHRMLFGERYRIESKPSDPDQVQVFSGKSGLKIFQAPGALPRLWTVHRALSVDSLDAGRFQFYDPKFDPRSTAILESPAPEMQSCQGAEPATFASGLDAVTISVKMQCAGMLVLSDTYDTDWKATVDGAPARIWPVDTAIRGIALPAGRHEIRMHYQPLSVFAGIAMFGLSICGLLALARLTSKGATPFEQPQR